jgi:DNA-binding beta-propeller fold protein YncE
MVLHRRGNGRMTRARAVLVGVPLALLAACGSQQAIKATVHKHTDAAPRPVSAPAPARAYTTPAPQALVTDEAQNRLLVVDLPSGRIARSVPLPSDPEDIAATDNGGVALVVSSRSGKVTVLNRDTLRTIKTFGGFDQPHIAAITPDYTYAYITDDALGTLTAINLYDMKVTSTVHVGAGAHHLAISPGERQIWVALGESARTITILTTVDWTPRGTSPIADLGHPWVIGHLTPGFPVHDLSFSPDGRRVWITSAAGPDVTVFDTHTRKALFRVPVGPPPQHLAVAGRYIYATSGYGRVIEKVDARTGRVVARASAPYGSFELAAADGYVTTASLLRGTLAIYTPDLKLLRVAKLAPATREVAISRP